MDLARKERLCASLGSSFLKILFGKLKYKTLKKKKIFSMSYSFFKLSLHFSYLYGFIKVNFIEIS